jgi:uncharacterized protein (UPF0264 family)
MGELRQTPELPRQKGLAYLKWGLAGCAEKDWRAALRSIREHLAQHSYGSSPVVVAYADWQRAGSPELRRLCDFACEHQFDAFLIDTWKKDGGTLLDWVSMDELQLLRAQCKSAELKLALAGSLGCREIAKLSALQPDWFAVRGAACRNGRRGDTIDAIAVRRLAHAATGRLLDLTAGS